MFQAGRQWSLFITSAIALAVGAAAQVSTTPLTFSGTTAVGGNSSAVTVTLTAQSSGQITAVNALTGGSSTKTEFTVTPLTCADNASLTANQTCTVSVVFSPGYPGVRQGAVEVMSGSQLLASAPLSGVGLGSLPMLIPGTINTVAGTNEWIYQSDGVPANTAPIFLPSGLAVDADGNLFLCDSSNDRVRRVDHASGLISTVAGNGNPGGSGDNSPATEAELNDPAGIAIDGAGDLYISDSGNSVVRRVDAVSGIITTFAGVMGTADYGGDGAAANAAFLSSPRGLALMPGGDLLIADSGNNRVRIVNIGSNQINTIAGTTAAGYNGDGIAANTAELNSPYGVAARSDGAIAIADLQNQRVRLVSPAGVISTAVGTGDMGAGTPQNEQLNSPAAVAFDPAGDLFIADSGNNRVLADMGSPSAFQTLVGIDSEAFSGDGGPANQASIYGPYGLVFDASGNLWLSDTFHNRVREVTSSLVLIPYPTMKVGNISAPVAGTMYNAGSAGLKLSAPVLDQAALDASTTTCNQSLMAPGISCKMGVEFAPTQVGANVTGSITWPSNAPNITPIDMLNGEVLDVNVTSVALTSSANPSVFGTSFILTATVSSDVVGQTGTVSFSDGGSAGCTNVTLGASGTASCPVSGLALGSYRFTAKYSGDMNNAASTSPPYTEVIKQSPLLVLTVSANPAVVTSTVTLTLATGEQSGTATGNVTFYDGATALGTIALDASGHAQLSTQFSLIATHLLSAQYAGDSANVSGTSNTVSEQIVQATTTTALTSSANPAAVGTPLLFTATVANNGGPAINGTITFYEDGSSFPGSGPISTSGTTSITVTSLTPGRHTMTANYSGNPDNAASTSNALAETIQQISTSTSLSADVNPLNAGATLHLTASVSLSAGATADGALTGSVTFRDGATSLGTVTIGASGQAALAVSTLGTGAHSLTAIFSGNTNYATSSSTALNETVQQTGTQTTLSSASSTTLIGKPASFTARVTSTTGIPQGQVSFRDGATILGTITLSSSGSATYSTSTLARGTHSITAVYVGSSSYMTSTSAVVEQIVQLAQPTLTLAGPTTAVDAGTPAGFTVSLTTPGIAPTGTLSLLSGAAVIGTHPVSGDASFTFSTSTLSIGTHTLTASYGGDGNNSPVTSASITVVIRQADSTTTLASNSNPLTQGNLLTLTARVSSDSPNAGGQIRFLDGAGLLGTVTLAANGTAIFSTSTLGLGTHSLTAVYSGDTNHGASTSAPTIELVVQGVQASLTSNNNPSESGQNVTFTGVVGAGNKLIATGAATFRDNGALLATVTLNSTGAASFTTSALAVGSHTITMSYSGDENFSAATAQLIQIVTTANTQIAISASTNPSTYAQPVDLVATIKSKGGIATGSVTFLDGQTRIGAAKLDSSGIAVLTISSLAPGAHSIIAEYAGDGKADPGVSTPLNLSVKQTTALTISSSSNPAFTLSTVSFTATVKNAGAAPATGIISFADGGTTIGTSPIDGTGRATLTLPSMSAGSHIIVASYAGDGSNFAITSTAFNQTVRLRPTSTTVTGSSTDLSNPQQVTLIGVVEGQGSVPPGGTVTFISGNVTLGQATVSSTGVATITVVFSQLTQAVTASYSGDVNYAASQSSSTSITAGEAAQFTVSVNAPTVTLVTHQHATMTVSIGSVKGFTDKIELGCLGLPYASTCTFTPSQVTLSADGTSTATLIVDTGDPLGSGSGTTASLAQNRATYLCWLPIGLLAGFLRSKRSKATRRRLGMLLVLVAATAVALGASGCGGLMTSATAPGTYSIKVVGTGQGSGISETQTITLVVTQ